MSRDRRSTSTAASNGLRRSLASPNIGVLNAQSTPVRSSSSVVEGIWALPNSATTTQGFRTPTSESGKFPGNPVDQPMLVHRAFGRQVAGRTHVCASPSRLRLSKLPVDETRQPALTVTTEDDGRTRVRRLRGTGDRCARPRVADRAAVVPARSCHALPRQSPPRSDLQVDPGSSGS
jgi:hypothetical protein